MNVLHLWPLLQQAAPNTDMLSSGLRALRRLPLTERFPFFGFFDRLVNHEDASVRQEAVRALGGAQGTIAYQWMVAALDDVSPEVQRAAVDALFVSTARCEWTARFAHAVFHPSPQVRHWACHCGATLLDPYLLADPACRETVLTRWGAFRRRGLPITSTRRYAGSPEPPEAWVLIDSLAAGWLSPSRFREFVQPEELTHVISVTSRGLKTLQPFLKAMEAGDQDGLLADHPFFDLFERGLMPDLAGPASGAPSELASAAGSSTRPTPAGVSRDPPEDQYPLRSRNTVAPFYQQLALASLGGRARPSLACVLAVIRASIKARAWDPEAIAFCSSTLPQLLAMDWIPRDTRRQALAFHGRHGRGALKAAPNPMAILESGVCRMPSGRLDLLALAGLLLHARDSAPLVLAHLNRSDMLEALEAAPQDAIPLLRTLTGAPTNLRSAPMPDPGLAARLLETAARRLEGTLHFPALLRLVWQGTHSSGRPLAKWRTDPQAAVARHPPSEWLDLIGEMLEVATLWELSPEDTAAFAKAVCTALPPARSPELLVRLAQTPVSLEDHLSAPLLTEVVAALKDHGRQPASASHEQGVQPHPASLATPSLSAPAPTGDTPSPYPRVEFACRLLSRWWQRGECHPLLRWARQEFPQAAVASEGIPLLHRVSEAEAALLIDGSETEFRRALEPVLLTPSIGLCRALRRRDPASFTGDTAALALTALLGCYDPLDEVDALFHQHESVDLDALEIGALGRWAIERTLPIWGHAWLYDHPVHRQRFATGLRMFAVNWDASKPCTQCAKPFGSPRTQCQHCGHPPLKGGLGEFLARTHRLRSRWLKERMWQASATLFASYNVTRAAEEVTGAETAHGSTLRLPQLRNLLNQSPVDWERLKQCNPFYVLVEAWRQRGPLARIACGMLDRILRQVGIPRFSESVSAEIAPLAELDQLAGMLGRTAMRQTARCHLLTLLESGLDHDPLNQHSVARTLFDHGDPSGLPILISEGLATNALPDCQAPLGHGPVSGELRVAIVRAALAAGPEICDLKRLTRFLGLDEPRTSVQSQCQPALELLLREGDRELQSVALQALTETPARTTVLLQLGRCSEWAVREARKLLGRDVEIRWSLLNGCGSVDLDTFVISVNPTPLLVGSAAGDSVIKGLLLHEIGHLLYHREPAHRKVHGKSFGRGVTALLNLVLDEHLERNLRALDGSYGNLFKATAAYVFLHSMRELSLQHLLPALGGDALPTLTAAKLEVAHEPGSLIVRQGKLWQALERSGNHLAIFIRALRMGLRGRVDNAKVNEALALFDKRFRHYDAESLYEVALHLQDIFGAAPCRRQSSAFHTVEWWGETDDKGIRVSIENGTLASAIQQAVARDRGAGDPPGPIEDTTPNPSMPREQAASPRLVLFINEGSEIRFPPIPQVEHLAFDPALHARFAAAVAPYVPEWRHTLVALGQVGRQERHRTRGSRLDRSRLATLALRGDPRFLIRSSPRAQLDLFAGVLVDCSASMSAGNHLDLAKHVATTIALAARGLPGCDARFFGFQSTLLFDAGNSRRCAVAGLRADQGNNDAGALWHVAQLARASQRRVKVLLMISDGLPTHCTTTALAALVRRLTADHRLHCLQVALVPLRAVCFPQHAVLRNPQSPDSIRDVARELRRRFAGRPAIG